MFRPLSFHRALRKETYEEQLRAYQQQGNARKLALLVLPCVNQAIDMASTECGEIDVNKFHRALVIKCIGGYSTASFEDWLAFANFMPPSTGADEDVVEYLDRACEYVFCLMRSADATSDSSTTASK